MRILITGGTGLIGQALCPALAANNHQITVLTRNPNYPARRNLPDVSLQQWDGKTAKGWGHLVDETDAIINLAGAGIADSRWSEERKEQIKQSRIDSGQAILEAIGQATNKPKVLIQSSAVGYYGASDDEILNEKSPTGNDYLAKVCAAWEASTAEAEKMGIRRPVLRTGIVLSNDGGAFPKLVLPFKLFAGGPVGSGDQWYPWIHMEDEVRAIQFVLENEKANGPFNLSAPNPLTNKALAQAIGKVMGRPAFAPAPGFAMKLVLGEMSTIVLDGQRAVPERLQELGFTFNYPEAEGALENLLN